MLVEYYMYGVHIADIERANNILKPNLIPPYDILIIGLDSNIPLEQNIENNFGIENISDLKMLIFNEDEFIIKR